MLPSPAGRGGGGEGEGVQGARSALTSPHPPPLPKGEEGALVPSKAEAVRWAGVAQASFVANQSGDEAPLSLWERGRG